MQGSDHRAVDDVSGTETTGHEWDGIRELDTPLPRWWLYLFYACIAIAVVYWVLMPAWPLPNGYTPGVLGFSDRANVARELDALKAARSASFQRLGHSSYDQIVADPQLAEFARAAGESAFGDNCATCHGQGGAGAPGYPNLADDVWLWDGTLGGIEHTIKVGVRSEHPDARFSAMPAYGRDGLLPASAIADVTEYVIAGSPLSRKIEVNRAAAARGAEVYQTQCAGCHGASGAGDRTFGAPSLRDDVWLYGGSRAEIRKQIELGRGGVMPTWEKRLDPALVRALAVYVFSLGGGERDATVATVAAPTTDPSSSVESGAAPQVVATPAPTPERP